MSAKIRKRFYGVNWPWRRSIVAMRAISELIEVHRAGPSTNSLSWLTSDAPLLARLINGRCVDKTVKYEQLLISRLTIVGPWNGLHTHTHTHTHEIIILFLDLISNCFRINSIKIIRHLCEYTDIDRNWWKKLNVQRKSSVTWSKEIGGYFSNKVYTKYTRWSRIRISGMEQFY